MSPEVRTPPDGEGADIASLQRLLKELTATPAAAKSAASEKGAAPPRQLSVASVADKARQQMAPAKG